MEAYEENQIATENSLKRDCILLVDDRPENLFALESMLEAPDRCFYRAQSGNEALKLAYKENISLILMDVQMPEMDGLETVRLLKTNEKTKKIPVIFVTAFNKDSNQLLHGLQQGGVDYLFKPLDVDIVRAKVDVMLKLQRQQRELEVINQKLGIINEEKNRLMGIAAHDLRNPANNILMMSDIVMEMAEGKLGDESFEFLRMMRVTAEHMLNVVNNILDVSRIESGNLPVNKKNTNLVKLIEDNVKLNSFVARKKDIAITFTPEEPAVIREIDPSLIEQVMNNLISNAVKFSHRNTNVRVTLSSVKDKALITVRDEGQGIPEKELNRLFKFFSRTSVQGTNGEVSTGLGLAISKKIIEAHGGSIRVESQPGVGSTFSVEI
jgi:signal transduction histidine kinase